jgi:hypothetical protein
MLKKILITFLILPIIGGAIYGYFYFKQIKTPLTPVISVVPDDAIFISRANDFSATWKSFSTENSIWKAMLSVNAFSEMHGKVMLFDSLFREGVKRLNIQKDLPVYLSVHPDSSAGFSYLIGFNIPVNVDKNLVAEYLESVVNPGFDKKQKLVLGVALTTLKWPDERTLCYYQTQGVFVFGFSEALVSNSIDVFQNDKSLFKDPSFVQVHKTSSRDKDGNVFVNFSNLAKVLPSFLNEENQFFINTLAGFARWTSLDVSLQNDNVLMNGFTFSSDSLNDYLKIFNGQKASMIKAPEVMPLNTAYFMYLGVSEADKYLKELEQLNPNRKLLENIQQTESKLGISFRKFFLDWIGEEAIVAMSEKLNDRFMAETYAVFACRNQEAAKRSLRELSQSIVINQQRSADSLEENYRGYTIHEVPVAGILRYQWGRAFPEYATHYVSVVNNYMVFSDNPGTLRSIINFLMAGRTLSRNANYKSFAKSLSTHSNLFVYSAVSRSPEIYKSIASKSVSKDIAKHEPLLRKFQAFAIQFSASGKLFYNTICLKYNPVYRPESNSLWTAELDSAIIRQPVYIQVNSDTLPNIICVDAGNTVYRINSRGQIVWKRKLDSPIIGEASVVNHKEESSVILVTATNLYRFDQEGEDWPGFPVELKVKPSIGPGVFDFEKKNDPVILIAQNDLRVICYNSRGRLQTEWRTELLKDTLKTPFQGFTMNSRDCILSIDRSGNIKLIDAKGNWVERYKEPLKDFNDDYFAVERSREISKCNIWTLDNSGAMNKYPLKGKPETFELLPAKADDKVYFNFPDLNADGKREFAFAYKNKLLVKDKNKVMLFDELFREQIINAPQLLSFSDSLNFMVCFTEGEKGAHIYKIEEKTLIKINQLNSRFHLLPLTIQNGKYRFVVCASGKMVEAVALDEHKKKQPKESL